MPSRYRTPLVLKIFPRVPRGLFGSGKAGERVTAWLERRVPRELGGGRVIGPELAKALIPAFLSAHYIGDEPGGERLARRVGKIRKMDEASK